MREATDDGSSGKDGDTIKQHFARMPHMFSVPRHAAEDCFPHLEEFEEYAEKAKTLPDTTTNERKLCLYNLYKQATIGPVNTGIFTFYAPFLSFPYY
ncbi:Acyl-CoA-binding protein [Hordeum vulgare]|nr:Acyl-CoA-binding protein [Hordeum vulgare]